MSKQEKIVCAAIRFTLVSNDSLRSIRETFMCVNYEDHFAKDAKAKMEGVEYFRIATKEKGFITNKNRFVDQREAMKIALKANQISSVEEVVIRVAHHKSLGDTYTARAEESALVSMVELYLARELKPEDLY